LGPNYLFELNGSVSVGLSAFIWAGIDVYLTRITFYRKQFDIFNAILVDFNYDPLDPGELATFDDTTGTLRLKMGEDSPLGVPNETFTVKQKGENLVVSAYGMSQEFAAAGITKITADAGEGNDTVIIRQGVTAAVELHGGAGDDTLQVYG